MSVAKVGAVVLDCPDPQALAGFYAGVVGGTPEGEGTGWTSRSPAVRRWRSSRPRATSRRSGRRPTTRSSSIST